MSMPTTGGGGYHQNIVTVILNNGATMEGMVTGLSAERPTFFLHSNRLDDETTSQEIAFSSVKMITFLKDASAKTQETFFPQSARLVTVRFMDGEMLRGVTQTYSGTRQGLFLVPTALENVARVFVPVSSIREVVSVKRLGEILTEQGVITPEKVEEAIRKQEALRNEPIGEILVKQRVITSQQLEQSLSIQQKRAGKKIGEILLEQNFINSAQLKVALNLQQEQRGKKIGQIMVDMGYVTFKMIGIALAIQYNVPFVDLSAQSVDPALRKFVTEELARRLTVVPLTLQENILTIAVTDPAEHGAEDELRVKTGLTIVVVVATPQDIARTTAKYYGA